MREASVYVYMHIVDKCDLFDSSNGERVGYRMLPAGIG